MFKLNRLFWSLIICSSVFVTTAVVTTSLTSCNEKKTSPDYSKLSDYVGKSDGSDWVTLDDNGNKNTNNGITGTIECRIENGYVVLFTNSNFTAHNLVIPNKVNMNGDIFPLNIINSYHFPSTFETLNKMNISGLLVIPNSVTNIGDDAFNGCANITSVIIPSSVAEIGEGAFYGCKLSNIIVDKDNNIYKTNKLDNFTFVVRKSINGEDLSQPYTRGWIVGCLACGDLNIQNDVQVIGDGAFMGCAGITSVYISSSVAEIGYEAFYGCKLSYIAVAGENIAYRADTLDGITFVTEKSHTIKPYTFSWIIGCLAYGDLKIQSDVQNIGDSTFAGCGGITSATISSTVTNIGQHAFEWCTSLTSIVFENGNGNLSIDYDAFAGCLNLTSVIFPNGDGNLSIEQYVFNGCAGLTSVIFSNKITSISWGAFEGCKKLSSITLPSSVTNISERAFAGCRFSNITVDNDNTKYTTDTVDGITFVTKKNIDGEDLPQPYTRGWIVGCLACGDLNIQSSIDSIGNSAFADCGGITSVNIPNTVMNIGEGAFASCTGLTSIFFQNRANALTIGGNAFAGCTGLISITPKKVTYIGSSTFYGCINLKSITIPEGATTINSGAFWGCISLTSITIPSTVRNISGDAFNGCINLSNVIFKSDPISYISTLKLPKLIGKFTLNFNFRNEESRNNTYRSLITNFPNWKITLLSSILP